MVKVMYSGYRFGFAQIRLHSAEDKLVWTMPSFARIFRLQYLITILCAAGTSNHYLLRVKWPVTRSFWLGMVIMYQ